MQCCDGGFATALCLSAAFRACVIAVVAMGSVFTMGSAGAQDLRGDFWVANGRVNAAALSPAGDILYIGGEFTEVGPSTGSWVAIDAATGHLQETLAGVAGSVSVAAPDGAGGWYIGGSFSSVGGVPRSELAHILADGTVADWNPDFPSYGWVSAMAVGGSTVYVGGDFWSAGGQPRRHLVALDAVTGAATAWNPDPDESVYALAVSGSTVYVGGFFTSIGGQTRNKLAALDAVTGAATAWNPDVNVPYTSVTVLTVSGSTIYVGGNFQSIGGQWRRNLAAVNATTGTPTAWNPNANGTPEALVVSGSTVYVAGYFTTIGGQTRNHIAALNSTSGAATAWNPNADGSTHSLAVSGSTVYAGGCFTSIGGQSRRRIAALSATTGAASGWNPRADACVEFLAVSGSTVYAGGSFRSFGGEVRNQIAALDVMTGVPTAWNPDANNRVYSLAVHGSTVYAGGDFTNIGGQTRTRIAALNATTGGATAWDPVANYRVYSLAANGSTVYAGGDFTSMGGQARNRIAALDAATGIATAWDPGSDGSVRALAVSGPTVYAGGEFGNIGGQPRLAIAALDAATGAATAWNPNADYWVRALAVDGPVVYVGGEFWHVGGLTRNNIAALDAATGAATTWNPNADGRVLALAIRGSTVYTGGYFTTIGGQERNSIAALDAATGAATAWNPNVSGEVDALSASAAAVYAGGYFSGISLLPRADIAAFGSVSEPACSVSPGTLDFGSVLAGAHADRSFVIRNTGPWDCYSLVGEVSESSAEYAILSGGGEFRLAAGESLTVTMRFSPTAPGSHPCTVETGDGLCSDVTCTGVGSPFEAIAGLPGVYYGDVSWGDYDGDGDLDLLLAGAIDQSTEMTAVYRNDDGVLTDIGAGLPAVRDCGVAWGDYDNDGDLDILLAGIADTGRISRVYRNDAGSFSDIGAGLSGLAYCSVAWGDYDNDGDLDILISGSLTGYSRFSRVYRNDGGVFSNIGAALPGVDHCSVAWGDYDNDGDLDILVAGWGGAAQVTQLRRNDDGVFTYVAAGLPAVERCSVAWGDYDNDGDLDILLAGYSTSSGRITRVYRNDGGVFTNIVAGLTGADGASAAWGDYDNDGDLDILLAGRSPDTTRIGRVYRNDAGVFADMGAGFTGVSGSSAAWADYDNDGRLDALLGGETADGSYATTLYRNLCPTPNTAPGPPPNLTTDVVDNVATFHWDAATDGQTPAAGLTYNLRIGATAGGEQVMPGMAGAATGFRRIVQMGNACHGTDWSIALPGAGDYYWTVQSVDGAFAGSPFAVENALTLPGVCNVWPTELDFANVTVGSFADRSFIIRNVGEDPLAGSVGETCTPYSIRAGGGPFSIAAGESITVVVRFTPTAEGSFPCTIETGPGLCDDVACAGTAMFAFTEIGAGLPGVRYGTVVWGDYDSDDDLDVLLAGSTDSTTVVAGVYRNDGGLFTDMNAGLTGVSQSSAAWGDCDNDGDLDILLAGWTGAMPVTQVYRNDGGNFTDIGAGLPGVAYCSVAWGDYDNDGDLDILLAGLTDATRVTRVYRNDGGSFTDIGAGLAGVAYCSVAWGDYDNDGDLDILLAGLTDAAHVTQVYRNDGGSFTDIGAGLTGVAYCSVAWGDYDNDGDLDILLAGSTTASRTTRVYRNNGGVFVDSGAAFLALTNCRVAWSDYDNDGDLDVFLAGFSGFGQYCRIYRNDGGSFVSFDAGFEAMEDCCAAWGDYDDDGDLDVLLAGYTGSEQVTHLYENNSLVANTKPSPPVNLSADLVGDVATFHWDASTDGQTPSAGLTYNLVIGTAPGGSQVMSGMASAATGYRRVVQLGNANHNTDWSVTLPGSGVYYCSVQAVDAAFAGSAFSAERVLDTQPATCSLEPDSLDFGTVILGGQADRSFVIRNSGGQFLTGSVGESCEHYSVTQGGGPFSLAAGESLAVTVRFSPTAEGPLPCTVETGAALCGGVECTGNGMPSFTGIDAGFPGLLDGGIDWGDYDGDGDLDALLAGSTGATAVTRVYRNDGSAFTDIAAGLTGVSDCSVAWGDCDNDGDLDILVAGVASGDEVARVYRNDGGVFNDMNAGLTGVSECSVAWGDYDNDGDLDILFAGLTHAGSPSTFVYRNDGGVFTSVGAGLAGTAFGEVAWGDYDNDGDLDILLAGSLISRVYRNDGGTFADIGAGLTGVTTGSGAWGDYDNDGELDILLAGYTGSTMISSVYRNDSGVFTDIGAGLAGVAFCDVAWGDCDNDGDLDILVAGMTDAMRVSRIYRNDDGVFVDTGAGLVGTSECSLAWGDCDNDGDLDILLAGSDPGGSAVALLYGNNWPAPDTAPDPPANLDVDLAGYAATFHWDSAADAETPPEGLTYNLRIGTVAGGSQVMPGMASAATGYRRVARLGNVNHNTDWTVTLPGDSLYYWSVQAEDPTLAGSPFAAERTLDLRPPACSVVPDTLDFGGVPVGESADRAFVVRNTGGGVLTGSISGSCEAYALVAGSGDFDLAADESLTVTVRFEPLEYGSRFCAIETGTASCGEVLCAGSGAGGPFWFEPFDYADGDLTVQSGLRWTTHNGTGPDIQVLDSLCVGDMANAPDDSRPLLVPRGAADTTYASFKVLIPSVAGTPGTNYFAHFRLDVSFRSKVWVTASGDAFTFGLTVGGNTLVPPVGAVWPEPLNYDTWYTVAILYDAALGVSRLWVDPEGEWSPCITATDSSVKGTLISSFALRQSSTAPGLWQFKVDDIAVGETFEDVAPAAVSYADVEAGLPGVVDGASAWGDYDNDEDLDLLVTGSTGSGYITNLYRNNGLGFTDVAAGLPGVTYSCAAWGDYDRDGDLDILLAGSAGSSKIARVYRNQYGSFSDIGAALTGVRDGSGAWGDYDNDGDLDILLAGYTGSTMISRVYRNDAGVFTDSGVALTGVHYSCVAWGDYDNDGDLDIVLSGETGSGASRTRIYRNDGASFANIGGGLAWTTYSAVAWGDYDGDGDLDIVLSGRMDDGARISKVYRNDGPGGFSEIAAGLPGVDRGSVAWGDHDGDGDLDILLAGDTGSSFITRVFSNEGGDVFADVGAALPGLYRGAAGWADYDGDGDLDVSLVGDTGFGYVSSLWESRGAPPNTPPAAPGGLAALIQGDRLVFSWAAALDAETPSAGLTYNLRVGTAPGGMDVLPGMSDADTGRRRVVQWGNANQNTEWTVRLPGSGTYYWSVQAVDAAFEGSLFSAEQILVTVGVEEQAAPRVFRLLAAAPNPFSRTTRLAYEVPEQARVQLRIYDVSGRLVQRFDEGRREPGLHAVEWDGRNAEGRKVAPGVYFAEICAGSRRETQRLVVLR